MSPGSRLRIFLVRHGQVAANREFRYIGNRDDALTEEGRLQAERLGSALSGVGAERIVVSPRLRARETARPIARDCGLDPTVDDRLAEQSFGRWGNKSRNHCLEAIPAFR